MAMKPDKICLSITMSTLLLTSTMVLSGTIPAFAETLAIIGPNQCLLGGIKNNGQWVKAKTISNEVKGPRKYRFFTLNGPVNEPMKELKIEPFDEGEFVAEPLQERDNEESASDDKPGTIGISSQYNIIPRIPRQLNPRNQDYIKIVEAELINKGIKKPEVRIEQAYAIDLDGDSVEEILLSATRYGDTMYPAKSGDYSAVFLLREVDGQIKTTMISGEFYPRNQKESSDDPPVNTHEVVAVTDLNSDGHLEIVVESSYYEGSEVYVFGINDGKVSKHLECSIGI